jgi:hypothetical protein
MAMSQGYLEHFITSMPLVPTSLPSQNLSRDFGGFTLQHYLSGLEPLPQDLERYMLLIRELDESVQGKWALHKRSSAIC